MRDASKFGAETTAAEVAEGIDLAGKLAVVTGGSSGIGQETARVLAASGAHVTRHGALHILVNNAGVMATPFAKTAYGFELQYAPSRIVSVSSSGHHLSPVVFEDIHSNDGSTASGWRTVIRRPRTSSLPSISSVASAATAYIRTRSIRAAS